MWRCMDVFTVDELPLDYYLSLWTIKPNPHQRCWCLKTLCRMGTSNSHREEQIEKWVKCTKEFLRAYRTRHDYIKSIVTTDEYLLSFTTPKRTIKKNAKLKGSQAPINAKVINSAKKIKECLQKFTEVKCSQMLKSVSDVSLSHHTIFRRDEDISSDIPYQLKVKLSDIECYSLALDENTDI
ncbi:unnamed protein product [Lepeophtheirus salmonis]|uniref:(salmon louse) hypothetical protein n=1 Tax=Lepeophtheirus salmonis TaxID=72036 RepID=A0A7R8CKW5_LEPSM|nr:unnamed protein product [Lepeophtheirus salmonis]CAF2849602.1 unnamed protein product [Lepeophtheirus salmonis]